MIWDFWITTVLDLLSAIVDLLPVYHLDCSQLEVGRYLAPIARFIDLTYLLGAIQAILFLEMAIVGIRLMLWMYKLVRG